MKGLEASPGFIQIRAQHLSAAWLLPPLLMRWAGFGQAPSREGTTQDHSIAV